MGRATPCLLAFERARFYRPLMASPQEILATLRTVPYPGFTRDVVSFGIVKDIEISSQGVTVIIAPTTTDREVLEQICTAIDTAVSAMDVGAVTVRVESPSAPPSQRPSGPRSIPGVAHVIAVASGKGGVGKSTIAANLAAALQRPLGRVGLMDADVYGPSVPVVLGIHDSPTSRGDKRLMPVMAHGLKVISMGLFLPDDAPVIWRGPMLTKLLTEFLHTVEWGELDCLVIDMPPGTGDVQLTITQQVNLTGGIVVTTPQDVALLDVKRGITMFEQVNTPVLGVLENMSYHECSGCGHRAEIFGHGGGARIAKELNVPFLGEIPLHRRLRESADAGVPIVLSEPDHPASRAIVEVAERVASHLQDTQAAQKREALRDSVSSETN